MRKLIKGVSNWYIILFIFTILLYLVLDSIELEKSNYDLNKIVDLSWRYESIDELKHSQPVTNEKPIATDRMNKNIQIFEGNRSEFLNVEFSSVNDFSMFCQTLENRGILLFENDIKEVGESYSTYLSKKIRKPLFKRLFSSYDDWIIIYKLEYENGRLFYDFTWNEGDGSNIYQLSRDNYPSEQIQEKGREIRKEIERVLSE